MKSLGPAMPFYVDDFMGGTTHFSAAEAGAYVFLLLEQWRNGFVPSDPTLLSRISRLRTDRLSAVLGKFYKDENGNLRNAKMDIIRAERMDYIDAQSRKGRWDRGNRGLTVVPTSVPTGGQPEDLSASASASPLAIPPRSDGGFTLEQCMEAAQGIGMRPEMVKAFFHHFDQYGWVGTQGRRITKLHSAMARWKADESNHAPKSHGSHPHQTMSDIVGDSEENIRKALS